MEIHPRVRRKTAFALTAAFLIYLQTNAVGLDCPSAPVQISRDSETEVNAAVAKIARIAGAELKTKTKTATQDLLGKLPSADKLYLEQMMFSSYCSALRDDKTISESEKAKRLKEYIDSVRAVTPPPNRRSMQNLTMKLVEFDLHSSDFRGSTIAVKTFPDVPADPSPERIKDLGNWVIAEINRAYPLRAAPGTFPIKVTVPSNSTTIELDPAPTVGHYKIYSWMINKKETSKIHVPVLYSDLTAVMKQAKINNDRSVFLHIDKPGYELESIEVPLSVGLERSFDLKKLNTGLTVLIEDFANGGIVSEGVASFLKRPGITPVGQNKFKDLERVRKENLENYQYLLNELRSDRFDVILSGVLQTN